MKLLLYILSGSSFAAAILKCRQANIIVDKSTYEADENIAIKWSFAPCIAQEGDWIGVYPESSGTNNLPAGSSLWIYCSGSQSYKSVVPDDESSAIFGPGGVDEGWPLSTGYYRAHLIRNVNAPYTVIASSTIFHVQEKNTCPAAHSPVSKNTHLPPNDSNKIDRIAFSSCYSPADQINDKLWKYLRDPFCKDSTCAWVWLGDNMYYDTNDMEKKRLAYNVARDDIYYKTHGPVAEPKIPTTGTWDDHDYAWNNMGKHYECKVQSQMEFAHHFNIPESDRRHPSHPNPQKGVYSSYMFHRLDGTPNGIHLINLDARSHRSLSYPTNYADCEGAQSTILGQTQWDWLQNELSRTSDIKIIASGIQVLPPTDKNGMQEMCAYLGNGQESFLNANKELGEGDDSISGTHYESWGEFPQERLKLLRMVQKSVVDGFTKQVIFISGDQHWAEVIVKDIPAVDDIPEVRVHEVTASGIDQWWNVDVPNPNRLRLRETEGGTECVFPFTYNGVEYKDCTNADHDVEWCYIVSNPTSGSSWDNCKSYNNIYSNVIASKEKICTDSAVHVCNAQANFGGIVVDWEERSVTLSILTPHEASPIAASVTFPLD